MEQVTATVKRVQSIDMLRGLVMVIMALDHVRDYFHAEVFFFPPEDMSQSYPALFLTRWITHFCAPVFVFLAGISAYIIGKKRKTTRGLSRFLLKRGLWLVFLEIVIVTFGWNFDIGFHFIVLQVIWAIGMSMILLAGLVYLPQRAILIISLVILFGHNLLDTVHVQGNTLQAFLYANIHEFGFFSISPSHVVIIGYPVIPWLGIMALGYCFGELYVNPKLAVHRERILIYTGAAMILLFILVRAINGYGDLLPWEVQKTPVMTLMSFLNTTKYPPSLSYTLMTIGPSLILLALFEKVKHGAILVNIGRVPLFYYVIHIYLIHGIAMVAAQAQGFGWQAMIFSKQPIFGNTLLQGYGFSLLVVYVVWIGVVAFLYPFCKRYGEYKRKHRDKWWLSYL